MIRVSLTEYPDQKREGWFIMARGKRDNLIRLYTQVQNDLDRALGNVQKMTELYGEIKPEYTNFLEVIAHAILTIQEQLTAFRRRDM